MTRTRQRFDGIYRRTQAVIVHEYYTRPVRFFSLLGALLVIAGVLIYWKPIRAQIESVQHPASSISAQDRLLQPAPQFNGQLSDGDIRGASRSTPSSEALTFNLPPSPSGQQPKLTYLRGGAEIDPSREGLEVIKPENQSQGGVVELKNPHQTSAKPALYSLVAVDPATNTTYAQQDLAWGVLAFNPNYAVYPTGTEASLAMAVLNDRGQMVCDAALYLEITSPKGHLTTLGTADGSIQVNEQDCQKYAVTDKPDYVASYQPKEAGEYKVHLIAKVERGSRELTDSFSVADNQDFYLERQGATRIYPADPYTFNLKVHTNKDGIYSVTEKVPGSFEVSNMSSPVENCNLENSLKIDSDAAKQGSYGGEARQNCNLKITDAGDTKLLTWTFSAKASESMSLSYTFDAPDTSPEMYLLGPARIENCSIENSLIATKQGEGAMEANADKIENCDLKIASWQEPRSWMLASDETGSASGSRLFTSGFELQTITAGMEFSGSSSGSINTNGSFVRSGNASLFQDTSAGTGKYIRQQFASANTADGHYMRAYIYITSAPATDVVLLTFLNENLDIPGGTESGLAIKSDRTLYVCNYEDDTFPCASPIGSASTALSLNAWHRIELKEDSTTLASTKLEARLDGVSFGSGTVNHSAGSEWASFASAQGLDSYYDDVAVNNDSTTDITNGNWPGEGKVVTLRPNGAVSAGTNANWSNTGDAADCAAASPTCDTLVDDVPPDDATYVIESSDTTDVQTFNMTDSSTAGIGSNDSIRLVQGNYRTENNGGGGNKRILSIVDGANADAGSENSAANGTWNTNNLGGADAVANPVVSSYDRPGTTTTQVYPWTPTTIDSLQTKLSTADVTPDPLISEIWVNVEYISVTGGRMFTSGFEVQSTTAGMEWTAVTNTPTIDTTTKRTGSASLRANGWTTSTAEFLSYTMNAANADGTYYLRTYLRVATMPDSGNVNRIISFRDSGGTDRAYITLLNSGALELFDEDGQVGSDSTTLLATGTWYRIEMQFNRNAGTNGTVEAKIDGATAFATSSTRSISTGVDKIVLGGNLGAAAITAGDWYFDDVALNTNIGSSQISYPGPGGVIELTPNGDGDTVTWTNTYTNLDEVPPNDATDTVTSTTLNQIEEANLSASGLAASDAISVVSAGVRFNSSSTGISAFKVRIKDGANGTPLESNNILNNSTTWKTNIDTGPLIAPITAYTRPDRGDAWTSTTLDSAIIGVRETVDTADTQAVTAMWLTVDYYTPDITISGNAYADEATTAWVPCDGSTANISLVVNGGTASTTSCLDADGTYQFTGVTGVAAGNPVSVFFNATDKGVAVTVATDNTSNITLNPRKNIVWVKGESGSITNTNLDHCDSVTPAGCANVPYAVTSSNIVVESGIELHIQTAKTYAPGGNVTTPKMHVAGTYTGASETLILNGTGTSTSRPLYIDGGTFTASSNTTKFTGDGSVDVDRGGAFNALQFTPTLATTDQTYAFTSGAVTINGSFDINPTASSTTKTLTVNPVGDITVATGGTTTITGTTTGASTLDLRPASTDYNLSTGKLNITNTGSGGTLDATGAASTITLTTTSSTLWTQTGTFNTGTSTVVMNPDAAVTLTSNNAITFYNLTLSPAISTAGRTYTFGTSALTINGDFLIQPSGTQLLTVNPAANITVAVTKTTTITRTSTATSKLDLRPVSTDYTLTSGLINITTGGTLDATSFITDINITGTSGTLFTVTGTFIEGNSRVVFNGDGSPTALTANNAESNTFFSVQMSPTITDNRAYTFGASTLTIGNGIFEIFPTSAAAKTLTVNLGGNLTSSGTGAIFIFGGGAGPGRGKLDTTGSSYSITVNQLYILKGILIANNSIITLQCFSCGLSDVAFRLDIFGSTFTAGTSTVIINADSSPTITGGTGSFSGSNAFYNLQLTPAMSASRTYTFGSEAIDINGNFDIKPTATTTTIGLTVQMGGNITVAPTKTTTINAGDTNSPTVTLDTRPFSTDYNLTTGFLVLGDATGGADTLDAGSSASIITLTGTSGNLFTNAGTFTITSGTPTVSVTSGSGSPALLSGATTMYNLTINAPSATVINMGSAVTLATNGSLTVTAGVFNIDANNFTGPGASGTLTLTGSSSTLCLGGTTNSTTATCDSGATQTATRDMPVFNAYSFNAASTVRYLSNTTQTVDGTPTYGNLYLVPRITAAQIYNFEASTAPIINGDFTINPVKTTASTFTLNVKMAGDITVATSKTTTITGTTNAVGLLITHPVATDYNLTSGHLVMDNHGTLNAFSSSSTITLNATSGTLFTGAISLSPGTSTVVMNPDANVTLFAVGGDCDFGSSNDIYNLSLTPTLTDNRTYTFGNCSGNALYVGGNIMINPSSASAKTLTVDGGNSINDANSAYTNTLTVQGSGGGPATGKLDLNNDYSLDLGKVVIGDNGNLTADNSAIRLRATSGTLFTLSANGDFVAGTSTVDLYPDADVTLTSGTFTGSDALYDLWLDPTMSASRVYTFGSGAVDINGDFSILPDASAGSLTFTVNMGAAITVAAGKTTIIDGGGSSNNPNVLLDTTGGNYAFTSGKIVLAATETGTKTLVGNDSVITLTGTSGTLFSRDATYGIFTQGTSEVKVTGAGATTLLSSATTFHKLTINNSSNIVNAGAAITMSSADATNKLYVQSGTLDDGGNQIAGTTNGTMAMSSGTTLKIGNSSASVFPTNYTNGIITLNAASTVVYNATVNQNVSGVPTYGNLQFSRASGTPTKTLGAATTVNGNLTIDSSNTLDVDNTGNFALNVKGGWNNSGSFTARNGTVTFDGSGAQAINGNTTWYNLSISTSSARAITFEITKTQTIATGGSTTFQGASSNLLTLQSSTASTDWNFAIPVASSRTVDYTAGIDANATDSSVTATHSTCLRTTNWDCTTNTAPNDPTSEAQKKTDNTVIATGDWVSTTSIKFTASASDTDNPDTLQLCVEKDLTGTAFSNTEDSCGSGVAYSGSPVTVTVTISGQTDASEYHWQARVKDAAAAYSNWVVYGGNTDPNDRDYGLDTTACTYGSLVYDGTTEDVDATYNDGSLTSLSSNWDAFSCAASGLNKYQYSIGTTVGGTDIKNWTDNSTTESVTATSLNLHTNQKYYYNVRAVDSAANTSSVYSSDGQNVLPTISFSMSANTVNFAQLSGTNNFSDTKSVTLTSSTNAYGGYVIRQYAGDFLRFGTKTIPWFEGGSYATPATWGSVPCTSTVNCGYGYTSDDTTIQGSNLFSSGTKFAAFATAAFGDIVADHTDVVNGTSGPVSNEAFTITHKVAVDGLQSAHTYSATVYYILTGTF